MIYHVRHTCKGQVSPTQLCIEEDQLDQCQVPFGWHPPRLPEISRCDYLSHLTGVTVNDLQI